MFFDQIYMNKRKNWALLYAIQAFQLQYESSVDLMDYFQNVVLSQNHTFWFLVD